MDESINSVILITDDDAEDRSRMRRYLQSEGYGVLEAMDGEEALTMAGNAAVRIDLLITDIRMPQMNGSDLAKRILNLRPDLKVLFVSGYSLEISALLKACVEKSALINKSVDKKEFLSQVRQFIASPIPSNPA
ncbi:MAG: histidine kinase [Fibrobacteres bacterium]|nr:histidine kinase [Fibrobacterota bacterium]